MIEAAMYVALGFCTASLIGLAILPAFYRRAARLTEEALRAVNPTSYAEVRAAQDQQRARHAVDLRRVEQQLEEERAKAAKHHLETSRLRTEIAAHTKAHEAETADLKQQLDLLKGDEKAVDLLTAEIKTLKDKLADSEKALADSWKAEPEKTDAPQPDKPRDSGHDWMPAVDTMALATITGLEAEVATLKAKLAKLEPTVTSEIEASLAADSKSRLAELETQLIDTEAKYVAAQAEVTRLSLLVESGTSGETDARNGLTAQIEDLTRKNIQQQADLTSKERVLERMKGQVEKLQNDLTDSPALKDLRRDFKALAARIAVAGDAPVTIAKSTAPASATRAEAAADIPAAKPAAADSTSKAAKDQERAPSSSPTLSPFEVAVKSKRAESPAHAASGAGAAIGTASSAPSADSLNSAEIASAAEALVSRIVASNRRKDGAAKADTSKSDKAGGPVAKAKSTTRAGKGAKSKSIKQKKMYVA